eukprot:1195061-Prorocentrum_minimum.AAC.6
MAHAIIRGAYTCGSWQRGSRRKSTRPSAREGSADRSGGTACGSCSYAYRTIRYPCLPYPWWLKTKCKGRRTVTPASQKGGTQGRQGQLTQPPKRRVNLRSNVDRNGLTA